MKNRNKRLNEMEVNKKNALKFWESTYGKVTEATDFTGRTIHKAAYDQRGSKYCWNIDHLLPKSQGGKNNVENLICTHILTNSEKADSFPSFVANKKTFQIRKDKDKWKIVEVTNYNSEREEALKLWNECFGENTSEARDFTGRLIIREYFAKEDSDYGWYVDKYDEAKEFYSFNTFIANIKTIRERNSKTNFNANNINWRLRKMSDEAKKYYFENNDVFNIYNVSHVDSFIQDIEYKEDYWCNLVIIRTNFDDSKTAFMKTILHIVEKYDLRYSNFEENLLVLRFEIETKEELEKIYDFSILLKSYIPLFRKSFSLDEIQIYNILLQCDERRLYSDLEDLFSNSFSKKNERFALPKSRELFLAIKQGYYTSELVVNETVATNVNNKDGLNKNNKYPEFYDCGLYFTRIANNIQSLLDNQ